MRRWLLILLVALLPLRGWTAERITVDMATVELGMSAAMATMQDCPMKKGADGTAMFNHGCQSCQLCMSLAAPVFPLLEFQASAPGTSLPVPDERFSSAELARSAKPPIS
ncbi:hypothetical protein ACFJGW_16430 [Burkholderiaceae bacterium UC74_6]